MSPRDSTRGNYPATPDTALSAVRAAASDDPAARSAGFSALIEAYWKPLYKLLRVHWRCDRATAEDITQAFFADLLEGGDLRSYDPARGQFRTWLRACVSHFVQNQRLAERRIKRGGGRPVLSLDFDAADAELARGEADPGASAEALFDQELTRELFRASVADLNEKLEREGHSRRLEIFARYDLCDESTRPTYAKLAAEIGIPPTQVTNELAAARRELRHLLLSRLRRICASDAEFRAEARRILGVQA